MIDKNSIENLKNRLDVVEVVGNFLELKKNGANYKSICPFHSDTKPSLVISPSKQIYHCFACGAGGDAINFVMEYEKLTYPEAIEKLASMYNFSLTYANHEYKNSDDKKLLENLNLYYKKNLDNNTIALQYLKERGISEASIEKFEIGYAPHSEATLQFLRSHGYMMSDAMEVGVAGEGENGRAYARFIERITFPIRLASAKIVGFGGRTISGHQAKYVNSPQTKLFNKSYLLYGYHLAKEAIAQERTIIITEGYLDVIMLHQAGFNNAVATLGTALTKDHIPLIARFEPQVILAYDGDEAGIHAAFKAAVLLSNLKISGGVVIFGKGMDPADMVANKQIDALHKLFRTPQAFVEFCIEHIVKKYDLSDSVLIQKALEEATNYLKTLPEVVAQKYQGVLAAKLNIHENLVQVANAKSKPLHVRRTFEDILELTIIKTLLLKPSLVDTLLDSIDAAMFQTHTQALHCLLQNDKENPLLRKILIDDDIKTFNETDFINAMKPFLLNFYQNEYKRIKNSQMDYEHKIFAIKKIREKIFLLEKGRLVAYEHL